MIRETLTDLKTSKWLISCWYNNWFFLNYQKSSCNLNIPNFVCPSEGTGAYLWGVCWMKVDLKHEKSAQQAFSDIKHTQTRAFDFYWRDPYHEHLWKPPTSYCICWCKPRINGMSCICCIFEWAAWTRSRIITFIGGFALLLRLSEFCLLWFCMFCHLLHSLSSRGIHISLWKSTMLRHESPGATLG